MLSDTLICSLGEGGVVPPEYLGRYSVDGIVPTVAVSPATVEAVSDVLSFAFREGKMVTPWGGGTQMALGNRPRQVDLALDLRALHNVLFHEPSDLVVGVEAGITLVELQGMLAAKGQFLPLQAPLPSRATVGGILAADASGPSRLAYGSPRDWLIGIKVVHSNGVIAKSGGRVVKNVTGYDLNKLYVGSLGTLGVIVEAAFKVAPLSADDRTLVATYPTLGAAIHAARQLLCPSFTPHALVVIDREVATRLGGLGVAAHTEALLLALFAGRRAVVQRRADEAAAEVDRGGAVAVERLAHEDGVSLWQGVTDLGWTDDDARQLVVKVSGLPSQVRDLVALAGSLGPPTLSHGVVADVGYGSVRHLWWAQEGSAGQAHLPEEVVGRLREGARRCGAHVVVERCPVEVKDRIDVWGDSPEGIDIMRRIKQQLDPAGVLNPGRFAGGI